MPLLCHYYIDLLLLLLYFSGVVFTCCDCCPYNIHPKKMTVRSTTLSPEDGFSPEAITLKDNNNNNNNSDINNINTNGEEQVLDMVLPQWAEDHDWGEPLTVHEWDDVDNYRDKNGWKGRDLVHDRHAPVRILEYFVQWGNGQGVASCNRGGVGTVLSGIAHFTARAESHKGYCHGGSMCSLMDDVIGWCGFVTSGVCRPWTGFTVQINTNLKKPVRVDSFLLVRATITKIERRKVSIRAELIDPDENEHGGNNIHAIGEGLVVLNRGVLEDEGQSQSQPEQS
jgi:acyl-coenzyme A thioesterase PaaI-like protein